MADEKIETIPIPPVPVTVIGTGNAGAPLATGTVGITSDHQPNLVARVIPPTVAIFVRLGNTFLITLSGLVMASMTPAGGKLLYTSDFFHMLILCANLSIPVSLFGLIKDLVTIFGRLEGKYPLSTGSI
jgi:hypothetical protein